MPYYTLTLRGMLKLMSSSFDAENKEPKIKSESLSSLTPKLFRDDEVVIPFSS